MNNKIQGCIPKFAFLAWPVVWCVRLGEQRGTDILILKARLTGYFCCDFAAIFAPISSTISNRLYKLLAIQIAVESPVVYTAKSRLKSQQKSPL